ncbi:uncharacterized protein LOC144470743 [Augochlora pura]
MPQKLDVFHKIKNILDAAALQYYTFTPREERKKTLVLKGIGSDFTEKDVKEYINNKNLPNLEVVEVTKMSYDRNNRNKFHFIIHITPNSKSLALTNTKYILHQQVRWERLRKKGIFQCRRCQRIGHASSNCHLKFRCVKCGKDHGPIALGGVCEMDAPGNDTQVKCANCGNHGHPASYKGCPYLSMAQNIKKRANEIRRTLRSERTKKIDRFTTLGISYAVMAGNQYKSSFPPLRREINIEEKFNKVARYTNNVNTINKSQIIADTHKSEQNDNILQLEGLLNSFRDSMLSMMKEQLQEIDKKITNNARRIDYILDHFEN